MTICVRATQKFYFADVIKELTNNKQHLGHLKCLSPHLGPSDLLMVGGRLKNSPLPDASKHPILLPSKSHLAILIVDFLHQYFLHGGIRLIQNLLHRQYWIVGSRNLIKRRVFMCLKCYKSAASTRPQYMGDLPISRFEQGRCFINTALDFAGPYLLKSGPRRNSPITKAYIAVFVCMSVKAVHLELSNSLTTESCLAAPPPLCSCGENLTVKHLLDCIRHAPVRSSLSCKPSLLDEPEGVKAMLEYLKIIALYTKI
ncbi:hypothetical protein M8J77_003242 [Diaphorina citri]|nr:hypothetical protein M8J77_003242 [Diaphorina citri]